MNRQKREQVELVALRPVAPLRAAQTTAGRITRHWPARSAWARQSQRY